MSKPAARAAQVRAFCKLNLELDVLYKRPDGFHELRTVFQTISLADRIGVEFTPRRKTAIELDSATDIPDNLIVRAAQAVMDESGAKGVVRFGLEKIIPMGGGLGGGSADAAAVLIALPVLTGKPIPMPDLMRIGAALGSDVPFFLLGGTALGLGRGTELYPLPDAAWKHALVVAPDVHIATPAAYKALAREPLDQLTPSHVLQYISSFQFRVWSLGANRTSRNDFEAVVFKQYPQLKAVKVKLEKLGACPAALTGSGAALFGVFESREGAARAKDAFSGHRAYRVRLLNRREYRSAWRRSLLEHIEPGSNPGDWPLRSRYA